MFCWIFLVFGSTIMQCTTKFAATSVNGNYFIWWLLISVDNVMSCDVNMIKYICYEFLIRSRIKLCLQAVGFYVMHTHSNVRWISKINTNAVYNAISSLKSSTYSPWHASFKFSAQVLSEALIYDKTMVKIIYDLIDSMQLFFGKKNIYHTKNLLFRCSNSFA